MPSLILLQMSVQAIATITASIAAVSLTAAGIVIGVHRSATSKLHSRISNTQKESRVQLEKKVSKDSFVEFKDANEKRFDKVDEQVTVLHTKIDDNRTAIGELPEKIRAIVREEKG